MKRLAVTLATLLGLTSLAGRIAHANPADVEVWMSFASPASITATQWQAPPVTGVGAPLSYVIAVNNTGIDTITGLTVVDTVGPVLMNAVAHAPGGMTLSSVTSVPGVGTRYIWSGAGLTFGPATRWTFTIAGQAGLVCVPTAVSNSAWIQATAPGGSAEAFVPVVGSVLAPPAASIAVTKIQTPASPTLPGTPVTYHIVVANTGAATLSSVTVTDTMPPVAAGITTAQMDGPVGSIMAALPSVSGTTYVFITTAALNPGQAFTYTLTGYVGAVCGAVTVSSSALATAVAQCSAPAAMSNATGFTVTAPTLSIASAIVQSGGAGVGAPVSYELRVDNTGTATITQLVLVDTIPNLVMNVDATTHVPAGGWTVNGTPVSGGQLYRWASPGGFALMPGERLTITVTGDIGFTCAPITVSGTLVVEAFTPCAVVVQQPAAVGALITPVVPDIAISNALVGGGAAGAPVSYVITVSNLGMVTVNSLRIVDTVAPEFTAGWQSTAFALPVANSVGGSGTVYSWMIPTFTPGLTVTLSVTGLVGEVCAATTIGNTAYWAAAVPCVGSAAGTAYAASFAIPAPSSILTVTQAVVGGSGIGSPVTYRLDVTNVGSATVTGMAISDTLSPVVMNATGDQPAGFGTLSVVSTGSGTAYGWSATGLTWSPGVTYSFSITGNIGLVCAPATVTGTPMTAGTVACGPLTTYIGVPTGVVVAPASENINLFNVLTGGGAPGSPVTYAITISNNGTATVTGLRVVDTLPLEIVNVFQSPANALAVAATASGSVFSWFVPSVNPGVSFTLTLSGTVGAVCNTTTIGNTAYWEASWPCVAGGLSSAKAAAFTVPAPTISVSPGIAQTGTAGVGEALGYFITVQNTGTATITSLTVVDTIAAAIFGTGTVQPGGWLPATVSSTASGTMYVWSNASLSFAPGAILNFNINGMAGPVCAPTLLSNEALVIAGTACGTVWAPTGIATDTIQPHTESLLIGNVVGGGGPVGSPVTYTITVQNTGTATLTGIVVTNTLPAAITGVVQGGPFASLPVASTPSGTRYAWSAPTLFPGGPAAVLTLTGFVGEVCLPASVTSTALVVAVADCAGLVTAASASATMSIAAPTVAVTAGIGQLGFTQVGSISGYSFTVQNTGSATITSLTVTDTVPAQLFVTGTSEPATWPAPVVTSVPGSGTRYVWSNTGIQMAPGQMLMFTINGRIGMVCTDTPVSTQSYVEAVAACGAGTASSPAASDTISAPVTGLTIVKTQTPATAGIGQTVQFNISLQNTGTATLASVILVDTVSPVIANPVELGAAAGFTAAAVTGGASATRFVWSNTGPFYPGSAETFTIQGVMGLVCNPTTVSNTPYAIADAGCTATAVSTSTDSWLVQPHTTVVSVTTWMTPAAPAATNPVTYTIQVTNIGTATITSARITDSIAALITGAVAQTGPVGFAPPISSGLAGGGTHFEWSAAAISWAPGATLVFTVTGTVGTTGVTATAGSTAYVVATTSCANATAAQPSNVFTIAPTVVLASSIQSTAPATVSTTQQWLITYTVTNTGAGTANNVQAALWENGGVPHATMAGPWPAVPATIGASSGIVFTWTMTAFASSTGVPLFWTASATSSEFPLTGPVTTSGGVVIQSAAASVASAMTVDTTAVCVGQTFQVNLPVTNTGEAASINMSATVWQSAGAGVVAWGLANPPGPVTLNGGQTVVFTWTPTALAAGSVTLSATAMSLDANSGVATSSGVGTTPVVTVSSTAMVNAVLSFVPPSASVGQNISVRLYLSNAGGSPASMASPALPQINLGSGPLSPTAVGPGVLQPAGVAGSGYVQSWDYQPAVAGTHELTATGTGTTCGAMPVLTAATGSLAVVNAAVLSGTLLVTTPVSGTVVTGSVIVARLDVTNTGGANASGVMPGTMSILGGVPGVLMGPLGSATAYLNAGATATFIWTFTPTAVGTAGVSVVATGTDVNSLLGVSTGPQSTPVNVLVVNPAALTSVVTTSGGGCAGQPVTVNVQVANAAGAAVATVTSVTLWNGAAVPAPAAWGMPTPAVPFDLGPGQSQVFVWTVTPTGGGDLTYSASAAGTDTVRLVTVTSPTGAASNLAISSTAMVAATLTFAPPAATTGQVVQVRMALANAGGSAAAMNAVTLTQFNTGGGTLTPTSVGPATLQPAGIGGSVFVATWNFSTTTTGTHGLTATATGMTCASVPVLTPATGSLNVVGAAALSGTLIVTAPASGTEIVGGTVVVRLNVTNTGGADASGVTPGALTVFGGVGGTLSPVGSATAYIGAGATATFLWNLVPAAPGQAHFQVGAGGTDVLSALAVAMPTQTTPVGSQLIVNPAALTTVVSTTGGGCAGQPVTVNVQVSNAAGAAVATVGAISLWNSAAFPATAAVSGPAPALPFDLGPGQSQVFAYTATPSTSGDLTFTASASGADTVQAVTVTSAQGSAANVSVSSTALVAASLSFVPATASTGQVVQVRALLTNSGGSPASINALLPPQVNAGAGAAPSAVSVGPTTLQPAGLSGSVFAAIWNYTPTAAGTHNLTATGTGTTCGALAVLAPATGSLTVIAPAQLSATLIVTVPSGTVLVDGDLVVMELVVTNNGTAGANLVAPTVVTPLGPTGSMTGPILLSATGYLTASASATWMWTFTPTGIAGSAVVGLSVAAQGVDENSGAVVGTGTVSTLGPPLAWPLQVLGKADLQLVMDAPGSVIQGSVVTATIWAWNPGGSDLTINNPIAISEVDPSGVVGGPSAYTPGTPFVIPAGTSQSNAVAFQWNYNSVPAACGIFWTTAYVDGTENLTGRALGPVYLARMIGVTSTTYSGIVAGVPSPQRGEVATNSILTFTVYDTCSPPVPVSNVPVTLTIIGGDGVLDRNVTNTGATLQATAVLRIGNTAGQNVVRAEAQGGGNPSTAVVVDGTARSTTQDYLSQNLFDPKRGQAMKIRVFLPAAARVSARIFNLAGELVRTVNDQQMPAGVVVWDWDGRTDGGDFVANGVYFIQIVAGKDVQIKRVSVLKR